MGGLFSSDSEEQRKLEDQKIKIPPEIIITPKMKKAVKKMKLRKKELIYLWKCFSKIAISEYKRSKKTTQTAYVTKLILAKQLKQPLDIFYQNLFDRWDLDRNDMVTFDEFLIGLYKFLLTKPSKHHEYVFETFDADGDGYLMGDELKSILEELHGRDEFHQLTAGTAMMLYDRKQDGKIDLAEFEESIMHYPILMWRVTLCRERFIHRIAGRKFWHKLYVRLHPKSKNQHKAIWHQNIKGNILKCKRCFTVTGNVGIKLFQCILWPICPCLRTKGHLISKSPNHYSLKGGDDETNEVSLKIGQMISASATPSKSNKTRLEQSKVTANLFSNTQQVERRLDMEVLGDHDPSDSEIRDFVEKQTRFKRTAKKHKVDY